MFSCKVIFGENDPADENEPVEYEFDTKAELDAFISGMNAAVGWMEFEVLEDRDDEGVESNGRDGYCIGGAAVCCDCLNDAENSSDQTALLSGEPYDCSRCDGVFVQPR